MPALTVDPSTTLTMISSGTMKAGATMPHSITSAWATVDAWADRARTAATPTPDLLDRVLDVAGEGKDPYKDARTVRDVLARTIQPAAIMDRLDKRVATLRWAAVAEHQDDLVATWAGVVAEAGHALAEAAEMFHKDDLGDASTLVALGGKVAASWASATAAADRIMHVERAYSAFLGQQRNRLHDRTLAPVWLAPLNADQVTAWTRRPQDYRTPGGGDKTWAAPWWLARNGVHFDLADPAQLGERLAALAERTAARQRQDAADEAALRNSGRRPDGSMLQL